VRDNTNVFVTSDHGFSTVSRREVDAAGRGTGSYSATLRYVDASGRQDVNTGHLPPGFLAIDLARHLDLPLYDPEVQTDEGGVRRYMRIDPTATQPRSAQKPLGSAALIGGTGKISRPTDARVVVAQTSIYIPSNDRDLIQRIVRFLAAQDYAGGLFVNDRWGEVPGALRMSEIGLVGSATTPKPAIVVNFKSFSLDAKNPHMTGVIVGGIRQHGQGDHGSLARANTFNNMAAIGPDFKRRATVQSPVSNADVQPTLAYIMKMKIPSLGRLRGRVINEALAGGPATTRFTRAVSRSRPSDAGLSTVLMSQIADGRIYLDEACFTTAATCR
jgi:arylsulfatase A-like enzyme